MTPAMKLALGFLWFTSGSGVCSEAAAEDGRCSKDLLGAVLEAPSHAQGPEYVTLIQRSLVPRATPQRDAGQGTLAAQTLQAHAATPVTAAPAGDGWRVQAELEKLADMESLLSTALHAPLQRVDPIADAAAVRGLAEAAAMNASSASQDAPPPVTLEEVARAMPEIKDGLARLIVDRLPGSLSKLGGDVQQMQTQATQAAQQLRAAQRAQQVRAAQQQLQVAQWELLQAQAAAR
mmetsp:Transcript_69022/g.180904  ORF Transcript_69022/g.180904 Transcript_69022/m.180904 type:complete len:235 (+) Transcript_69022:82-786(+)